MMATAKMNKPIPCCARCKHWGSKWGKHDCEDTSPSSLCAWFDNDGTAENIRL